MADKEKKSLGTYSKGGAVILIIGVWVALSLIIKPLNNVGSGGDPLNKNVAPAVIANFVAVALIVVAVYISIKIWKHAKSDDKPK